MYQRIMEGMRREMDFEELLKLFVMAVRKGMDFKRAGVFLLEPDRKHAYLGMGTSPKGTFEKNNERIPIYDRRGENHFSDVINGYKKYFLSNNVPERISEKYKFRVPVFSNALVPIETAKGRIIGALAVDNLHQNRPITRSDVASLRNYSTQVGLAIESFQARDRIKSLSLTDSMTGLYNRRFFEQAITQEIKRCQRYKRAFSLLLIDIDHFKRVNDTYGHDAGDEIIKQVASLIKNALRGLDVVARVGGEEFAVILPETPPQNIGVVQDRLLREVRSARPAVSAMAVKGEKITFSIGSATYKKGDAAASSLLKLADKSLYQAKRSGRDRAGRLEIHENKKARPKEKRIKK